MLKIELIPEIDHCIETVAKREYAAVLKQLLTPGEESKELEEKLEILRLFLESVDFKNLRSVYERQLMEGGRARFVVYLDDGKLKYEMYTS
jgi:hypothetical protein